MPQSLADIMATPETARQAAEEFGAFCEAQTQNLDGMNRGVETADELAELFRQCGQCDDLTSIKKFCEIGDDD